MGWLLVTTQYSSIYATLLGANPVQLGSLQSAGNAVGARDQERLEGTQPARDSQKRRDPDRPRR